DRVVVAEARPADVDAARVDEQPVVEPRRLEIADVGLEHDRFDPQVAEPRIAAGVPLEVRDARDLEPDEVVRVVDDPLRVGLGEPHPHPGSETEPVHEAAMLAELIRQNQPRVAPTGAGISTESGIPDFRSPGGIWAEYDPAEVAP